MNKEKIPNTIEDEIDAIRIAQYERDKHLTNAESARQINEHAKGLAMEYGFTIVSSAINRPVAGA